MVPDKGSEKMYLYQRKNDDLEIIKIKATRRLCDYKKEEMNKIPFEMRVMDVETNDFSKKSTNLENAEDSIGYYRFVYDNYDSDFHTSEFSRIYRLDEFSNSNEIKCCKKILDEYYHQKKSSSKVLEVTHSRDEYINYLLLTREHYTHSSRESCMENIICLPKSLYLLELFLQEKFDLLTDEEIKEILKLFDMEGLVKKSSYEELKELRKFDIISKKEFKKIERGIEKSEKVLRLINQ